METPAKLCTHCEKMFWKKPSHSKKAWIETKFCSYLCYWESKKKIFTCVVCGNKFNRASYGKGQPKTCSQPCKNKHQSQIKIFSRNPCKVCGKSVKRASAVYCSVECRNIGYRGENVYNYMSEDIRKGAHPVDYAFWQNLAQDIRERDKTCQHCGKSPQDNGRALDVHHITPYRISQDNSPNNLIALCRACHKVADHEYNNK